MIKKPKKVESYGGLPGAIADLALFVYYRASKSVLRLCLGVLFLMAYACYVRAGSSMFPHADVAGLEHNAAAGDAESQFALGYLYAEGVLVARDFAKAAEWYEMAAGQGLAQARYNLGLLYEAGAGVPEDHAKALAFFKGIAAQSRDRVNYDLALSYELGSGVAQNLAAALNLYKAAARSHVYSPRVSPVRFPTDAGNETVFWGGGDVTGDAETRKNRRRALLLQRMHNDMRFATDNCFGAHRDLWYADIARPTPQISYDAAVMQQRPDRGDRPSATTSTLKPLPNRPTGSGVSPSGPSPSDPLPSGPSPSDPGSTPSTSPPSGPTPPPFIPPELPPDLPPEPPPGGD
jgi:hypothetical protein